MNAASNPNSAVTNLLVTHVLTAAGAEFIDSFNGIKSAIATLEAVLAGVEGNAATAPAMAATALTLNGAIGEVGVELQAALKGILERTAKLGGATVAVTAPAPAPVVVVTPAPAPAADEAPAVEVVAAAPAAPAPAPAPAVVEAAGAELVKSAVQAAGIEPPKKVPAWLAAYKNAPRYRDPATGALWGGRGPVPKWMQAYIAAGQSKDDFLIAKTEAAAAAPAEAAPVAVEAAPAVVVAEPEVPAPAPEKAEETHGSFDASGFGDELGTPAAAVEAVEPVVGEIDSINGALADLMVDGKKTDGGVSIDELFSQPASDLDLSGPAADDNSGSFDASLDSLPA